MVVDSSKRRVDRLSWPNFLLVLLSTDWTSLLIAIQKHVDSCISAISAIDRLTITLIYVGVSVHPLSTTLRVCRLLSASTANYSYSLCSSCTSNTKFLSAIQLSLKALIFISSSTRDPFPSHQGTNRSGGRGERKGMVSSIRVLDIIKVSG